MVLGASPRGGRGGPRGRWPGQASRPRGHRAHAPGPRACPPRPCSPASSAWSRSASASPPSSSAAWALGGRGRPAVRACSPSPSLRLRSGRRGRLVRLLRSLLGPAHDDPRRRRRSSPALVAVAAAVVDAPGFLSMRPDLPAAGVPAAGAHRARRVARRRPAHRAARGPRRRPPCAGHRGRSATPVPCAPSAWSRRSREPVRPARRQGLGRSSAPGSAAAASSPARPWSARAVAANPLTYALTPTDAYAAVCSCSGSNCDCGSLVLRRLHRVLLHPHAARTSARPAPLLGGWWKVDGSGFCSGPRYYMDCNAPCNGCGCGGSGICSGSVLGHRLRVRPRRLQQPQGRLRATSATASATSRSPASARSSAGSSPASPPWEIDGTCTTTARYDAATAYHDRPCLHKVVGDVNTAVETTLNGRPAIRVTGWAIDFDTKASIDVHVYVDGDYATRATAVASAARRRRRQPGPGPEPRVRRHHPGHARVSTTSASTASTAGRSATATPRIGCRTVAGRLAVRQPRGVRHRPEPGHASGAGPLDPDTTGPVERPRLRRRQLRPARAPPTSPAPTSARPSPRSARTTATRVTVPVAAGTHNVCVYAINVGNGSVNTQHRLPHRRRWATRSARSTWPTATAGGVEVSGWAIDPDQLTSPIDVQLRLDGDPVATVTAGESRPDVGSRLPVGGREPRLLPDRPRRRRVCTRSRRSRRQRRARHQPGARQPHASRCARGSPFGNLEHDLDRPRAPIRVAGGSSTPTTPAPSRCRSRSTAWSPPPPPPTSSRPDVGRRLPGLRRRCTASRSTCRPPTACASCGVVYAINVGRRLAGAARRAASCSSAATRSATSRTSWSPTAGSVRRRLGHRPRHRRSHRRPRLRRRQARALVGTANQARPDVGGAFPLLRCRTTASASRPRSPRGRHQVCVFAINQGPGTENVCSAARTVTA